MPSLVFADTASVNPESLQKRIEMVLDKAGISFGGVFRSEHFKSAISAEKGTNPDGRTMEYDDYSSVDLDIQARPNSSVSGRLILRLHHNWQNFWGDPGNPVFSRWISIDGSIAGKAPFSVGNFTVRYTPLTLHAPEVGPLYEPEIFEMRRHDAMEEAFLGYNERPLQGLTIGFNGSLAPFVDMVHVNVLTARLRSADSGLGNASLVVNSFEASPDFSKLLFGSDFEARLLHNFLLGGSYLLIADNTAHSAAAQTAAQRTSIGAGRAEYDFARWLNLPEGQARLFGETAFSFDDSSRPDIDNTVNVRHADIVGSAAYCGLNLQSRLFNALRVDMDLRYLQNDLSFRNELAQSPTFFGRRIMNIESDSMTPGNPAIVFPNHYSTFDALYHHVFKFCPAKNTNRWAQAPFAKNAYANMVYTHDELRTIAAGNLDPSLQLVMPFGPATPNRRGVVVDCGAQSKDSGAQVKALLSALSEEKPDLVPGAGTTSRFLQAGAGLKVDLSKWLKRLPYPLRLSGSFTRSSAKNTSRFVVTSDFTNAGIFWKFWKQTALLGGLQVIDNTFTINDARLYQKQIHWSTGIAWSVTQGADVTGSIGRIIVNGSSSLESTTGPQKYSGGSFAQLLTDISLKVVF